MPSLSEPRCGQPSKSPPRKNKQAFDNAHAATMTFGRTEAPSVPQPQSIQHTTATPRKIPSPRTPFTRLGNFPNPRNRLQTTNFRQPHPIGTPFQPARHASLKSSNSTDSPIWQSGRTSSSLGQTTSAAVLSALIRVHRRLSRLFPHPRNPPPLPRLALIGRKG